MKAGGQPYASTRTNDHVSDTPREKSSTPRLCLNDTRIAERVGCSIWTVRTWRRRSIHQGCVGFKSQIGRPTTGPLSTFPKQLQKTILHLRKLHPGWGPNTLLAELKMDGDFRNQPLPSRACNARLLKQAALTRRDLPHHGLLQPPRMLTNTPHQEWQMDAVSKSCESREWARSD